MAKTCKTCCDPRRAEIERRRYEEGWSLERLARWLQRDSDSSHQERAAISASALQRHFAHVPRTPPGLQRLKQIGRQTRRIGAVPPSGGKGLVSARDLADAIAREIIPGLQARGLIQ